MLICKIITSSFVILVLLLMLREASERSKLYDVCKFFEFLSGLVIILTLLSTSVAVWL